MQKEQAEVKGRAKGAVGAGWQLRRTAGVQQSPRDFTQLQSEHYSTLIAPLQAELLSNKGVGGGGRAEADPFAAEPSAFLLPTSHFVTCQRINHLSPLVLASQEPIH